MAEVNGEGDVVEARGVARELRADDLGDGAWDAARPVLIRW